MLSPSYRFALLAVCFIVRIGVADDSLEKKLAAYIDQEAKQGRFSGSVVVARKGKVLLSRGVGLANREHDVPNKPNTKFRLGSITKQFTAMAIMILEEQKKLKTSDAISKYVESSPAAWKKVTIHHLLTHTSGIPNFTSFPDYRKRMATPSTVKQTIDRFREKKLEFEPGKKFRYSNSGYILLGAVIEKVSGKTYENFLQESIFKPLGMKDSGYDSTARIIKNRAAGYTSRRLVQTNASFIHMSIPHAAGAIYSTVEDLQRWDSALQAKRLISAEGYQRMYTPFLNSYAYGWLTRARFGRKCQSHGGGINGFRTHIARYPDDQVLVVVLSNLESSPVSAISNKLSEITLGKKP